MRWFTVKATDERIIPIYRRHYASLGRRHLNHHRGIDGPGESAVYLTVRCDALWVWRLRPSWLERKANYDDGQRGLMCSLFRNEGPEQSSSLIIEAMELATNRWPNEHRYFTYVKTKHIASVNPGYCYKAAGWRTCEKRDGLHVLEYLR